MKKKRDLEKERLKKQEEIVKEWREHNKRMKAARVPIISLDEFIKRQYGGRRVGLKGDAPYKISIPAWAVTNKHAKSVHTNTPMPTKKSIMNDVTMGRLSEEDSELVIRKAGRIGLSTSKGAYTYITDETDTKTLGKKTQSLD
jgi:hypothetical protein